MSFDHPSANYNSAGFNPDPLTDARIRDAENYTRHRQQEIGNPLQPITDLFQWKRLSEDVIHFTPFDDLPRVQQDAARLRRAKAFKESHVPWILTDAQGLLTFLDDVDDLGKSAHFLKDYALKPAKNLAKGDSPFHDADWRTYKDMWDEQCDLPIPFRERKLRLLDNTWNNVLALLALEGLKTLFPAWRFAALGLQALQTLDMVTGYGLQLGPIMGALAEATFRGLDLIGAPFGPDSNKYNQIKAARVTQRINRGLAASDHLHPDDALGVGAAGLAASNRNALPYIVISPDDYPDLERGIITPLQRAWRDGVTDYDPWSPSSWPPMAEAWKAAKLAASLPYNLGAAGVNNLIAPMLNNWSEAIGGPGQGGTIKPQLDSMGRTVTDLIDKGFCPGGQCPAEIDIDLAIMLTENDRVGVDTDTPITREDLANRLGWRQRQRET